MERTERESLIERYLRGEMDTAEEQDFFIEVASNSEFRYDLKAYQTLSEAMLKDRKFAETSYNSVRSTIATKLGMAEQSLQNNVMPHMATPSATVMSGSTTSGWIVAIATATLVSLTALTIAVLAILKSEHPTTDSSDSTGQITTLPHDETTTTTPIQPSRDETVTTSEQEDKRTEVPLSSTKRTDENNGYRKPDGRQAESQTDPNRSTSLSATGTTYTDSTSFPQTALENPAGESASELLPEDRAGDTPPPTGTIPFNIEIPENK